MLTGADSLQEHIPTQFLNGSSYCPVPPFSGHPWKPRSVRRILPRTAPLHTPGQPRSDLCLPLPPQAHSPYCNGRSPKETEKNKGRPKGRSGKPWDETQEGTGRSPGNSDSLPRNYPPYGSPCFQGFPAPLSWSLKYFLYSPAGNSQETLS